mmetsp:Transcript_86803/g.273972  ORF Transcript_86803/g.273972 Transcript_86803/m.273972 type:complete len:309 (+) Transcript_86803:1225-2151(+)
MGDCGGGRAVGEGSCSSASRAALRSDAAADSARSCAAGGGTFWASAGGGGVAAAELERLGLASNSQMPPHVGVSSGSSPSLTSWSRASTKANKPSSAAVPTTLPPSVASSSASSSAAACTGPPPAQRSSRRAARSCRRPVATIACTPTSVQAAFSSRMSLPPAYAPYTTSQKRLTSCQYFAHAARRPWSPASAVAGGSCSEASSEGDEGMSRTRTSRAERPKACRSRRVSYSRRRPGCSSSAPEPWPNMTQAEVGQYRQSPPAPRLDQPPARQDSAPTARPKSTRPKSGGRPSPRSSRSMLRGWTSRW